MEKSFEDALKELEAIVKELEAGNVELDQAIDKYYHCVSRRCFQHFDTNHKLGR